MTSPTITASVEAPLTLTNEPPRTLGTWSQVAMWMSLGVSLFGPLTGALVALSVGSLTGGLLACLMGSVIGALALGGNAAIGAATGAPAMAGMRGMFGRGGSILPTVLNIIQNVGWGTMEIIVISSAAAGVLGASWRWPFVIVAGVLCTIMAIRPLGSVKVLRTIMLWLVVLCSVWLFVIVLREPVHPLDQSSVIGFAPAVDLAAAQVISFCPLVADYSRHSVGKRPAFTGTTIGYFIAVMAYYALGVFAVAHLSGDMSGTNLLTALIALPAGAIAIALLLVDELDQAFANVYSTTQSIHNLLPRVDRRIVSVVIGVLATLLAGLWDFSQYENFLYLLGSAFVPLAAVAIVDFFLVSRQQWDVSEQARVRWAPTVAWLLGFLSYQLIYPGSVPGWSSVFSRIDAAIGFTAPAWLGSTIGSMVIAGLAALVLGLLSRPRGHAPSSEVA